MRDGFDQRFLRDAVGAGKGEVGSKLVGAIHGDEGSHSDEAPVSLGQLRALPDITVEDVVCQFDELGREISHQALRGCGLPGCELLIGTGGWAWRSGERG